MEALGVLVRQVVREELPLFLEEFYMWYIAIHIFWAGFGLLLILVAGILHKVFKYEKDGTDSLYDQYEMPPFIVVGSIFLLGLMVTFANIYYLVFILTAPRVYLVNYFLSHL